MRSALALTETVPKLRTHHDGALKVRVDIATGVVVVGDLIGEGDAQERGVVGETPNVAARLQSLSEPGQVVIADSTRRLSNIVRYDPTTAAAQQRGLAKKWVDLFHVTRDEFTKEISRIDVAHRATRLRMLSRAAHKYEADEVYVLMAQMLEQIAKECGDAYSNRREVTGKDGAPLQAPTIINFDSLNLAELERLEALADAAIAKGRKTIDIPFTPLQPTS